MTPRLLIYISALTALLVAATVYVLSGHQNSPGGQQGQILWPDLEDKLNDFDRLTVQGPDGETAITRGPTGVWRLEQKSGYPVEFDLVRHAIVGLSRLTVVAPMTRKPENFTKLGVEDFSQGASSKQVTMYRDGVRYAFLIGRYVVARDAAPDGQAEFYIRAAGDTQSWHVRGPFSVPDKPLDWLDLKVVEVPRDEINWVSVVHADGDVVKVSMPSQGGENFQIENVPDGFEPKTAFIANSVGSSLGWLTVDDVAPLGEVPASASISHYSTWDDTHYEVSVFKREGGWWFAIKQLNGADMEEFNARVQGWAYAISEYKAQDFAKRMTDLVKPAGTE